MEKIGYATCQSLGDCGSGTWGNIKTTASTVYVDQSHAGAGGKGTKAEPFKTIGEALKQATAGDHIAVAAGTYYERVIIQRKITLEGRCAQMVTIKTVLAKPAVEMKSWANGSVIRGLTITGAGLGLWLDGVSTTVEQVVVQGCQDGGIDVESGGTLTLRDSLVADNLTVGIFIYSSIVSSKATLERTVVRDTLKDGNGKYGDAIVGSTKATLDVKDTMVERSARAGFLFVDSGGSVHRSLIRSNIFAIDLEKGAAPTIGDDNLMVNNQSNQVTIGQGLKAAPVPPVPNPFGSDAGPDAGLGAQ